MARLILAVNAGSSSVKITVYRNSNGTKPPAALATAQVSGLTAPPAKLTYRCGDKRIKDCEIKTQNVSSQASAFHYILQELQNDSGLSQLKHKDDIEFVCHRVVHGGDYADAQRIDRSTYHRLEALSALAPLHNAGALDIVKAVHDELPSATNVAFFDSAFHATIPPPARTYAIDQSRAEKNGLRKYGFHGLSYSFVTRAVASHLSKPSNELNIIALHLGSGASACCIRAGESIDTSMGLTPLSGLPGATRSGDVDPSLVFHFTHDAGSPSPLSTRELHLTTAEELLNKKSGWNALTGTTDFGTVSAKAAQGDARCKLAFDIFLDRVVGFVASYYVKLEGKVDALVFAGGIGEKGTDLRQAVVDKCRCLGFAVERTAHEQLAEHDVVVDITGSDASLKVLVCRTDEQTEMARQCCVHADRYRTETENGQS